jgi:hypothetical protein
MRIQGILMNCAQLAENRIFFFFLMNVQFWLLCLTKEIAFAFLELLGRRERLGLDSCPVGQEEYTYLTLSLLDCVPRFRMSISGLMGGIVELVRVESAPASTTECALVVSISDELKQRLVCVPMHCFRVFVPASMYVF